MWQIALATEEGWSGFCRVTGNPSLKSCKVRIPLQSSRSLPNSPVFADESIRWNIWKDKHGFRLHLVDESSWAGMQNDARDSPLTLHCLLRLRLHLRPPCPLCCRNSPPGWCWHCTLGFQLARGTPRFRVGAAPINLPNTTRAAFTCLSRLTRIVLSTLNSDTIEASPFRFAMNFPVGKEL